MLLTDMTFPEDINEKPHGAFRADTENAAWFEIKLANGTLYVPVAKIRPLQDAGHGDDFIGFVRAKNVDGETRLEISVDLPRTVTFQGEPFNDRNLTGETGILESTAFAVQADWLAVPYDLVAVGNGFFMSEAEAKAIFNPDPDFIFQPDLWVFETRPKRGNPALPAKPAPTAG